MKITATILTIGDEILIGQILDTNSQWIAQELVKIGITIIKKTALSDDETAISKEVDKALSESDFTFVTGGLGPTKDDITKKTLTTYFDTSLILDKNRLKTLIDFYKAKNIPLNDDTRSQALYPKSCDIIPNEVGTACGMWFTKNKKHLISMPGVPFEMKTMMKNDILPRIQTENTLPSIYHRTIHTIGLAESNISVIIEDWENSLPDYLSLAYLPNLKMVRLRITGTHPDKKKLKDEIDTKVTQLYKLIPQYIYGEDGVTIQESVGMLLTDKKLTIATAESCTGGYLSHLLTSISGSSAYYKGSIIAYSNGIKIKLLDVPQDTLDTQGAVSETTIRLMAENVRKTLNTDIGLATSGIAGPDGGTEEKPVGTIWIAYADKKQTISKCLHLNKLREQNIKITAISLLDLLRKELNQN